MFRVLLAVPMVVWLLVQSASGGATLSLVVSDVITADSGGDATFDVEVLAADDSGMQELSAYDLFLEIGGPGGLPSGWLLSEPVEVTQIGDIFTSSVTPSEGDVLASAFNSTGVPFFLNASPVTLWKFQVNVSRTSGAVDGDVNIAFLESATNFGLSGGNNSPLHLIESPSVATVRLEGFSSVPEPSPFLLVGAMMVAHVGVRFRRRFG